MTSEHELQIVDYVQEDLSCVRVTKLTSSAMIASKTFSKVGCVSI